VSQLIAAHERSLMRVALHWSLCRDDALDAYQRALEIYIRRLDSLDPATEIAWMKVVVKHEALAVRRGRAEALPVEDLDRDGRAVESQRPVDDLLAGRERVRRSAEALRRVKPDEAKALMLKAQGLSYAEIGESLGWTYTKVNRCITEGRARFLKVYAEIEAGEECDRFAPTLAALVGGTASAAALLELRPHIRNCATCRATVRELHATRLGKLSALWPVPALVAPLRWVTARFGEGGAVPQPGRGGIVLEPGGHDVPELAPVEGITDLYDAIAPLELPARDAAEQPGRLVELKTQLWGWLHRLEGADVATGAQIAAGTGGGRVATIGAVIGLCLSGLGAGTVCVVTGVVHSPFAPERPQHAPARPEAGARPEPPRRRHEFEQPKQYQAATLSDEPTKNVRIRAHEPKAARANPGTTIERGNNPAAREFDFESGATRARPSQARAATISPTSRQATNFEEAVQQGSSSPVESSTNDSITAEFGGG
jgi:RNA polymerase sigma factor (sigma-70 family)